MNKDKYSYSYLVMIEDSSLSITRTARTIDEKVEISGNYIKGTSIGDKFFSSDCNEFIAGEEIVRNCEEKKIKSQLIYKLANGIESIKPISKKLIEVKFKY